MTHVHISDMIREGKLLQDNSNRVIPIDIHRISIHPRYDRWMNEHGGWDAMVLSADAEVEFKACEMLSPMSEYNLWGVYSGRIIMTHMTGFAHHHGIGTAEYRAVFKGEVTYNAQVYEMRVRGNGLHP